MTLLRNGTDKQKERAAGVLANIKKFWPKERLQAWVEDQRRAIEAAQNPRAAPVGATLPAAQTVAVAGPYAHR